VSWASLGSYVPSAQSGDSGSRTEWPALQCQRGGSSLSQGGRAFSSDISQRRLAYRRNRGLGRPTDVSQAISVRGQRSSGSQPHTRPNTSGTGTSRASNSPSEAAGRLHRRFSHIEPPFCRGEIAPCQSTCLPSRDQVDEQRFDWWGGQDSNLRRLRRRFYRPLPLAARAPPRTPSRVAHGPIGPAG
jgi:hypothetical protein